MTTFGSAGSVGCVGDGGFKPWYQVRHSVTSKQVGQVRVRPVFSLLFSKSKIRYISVHSSNQQISARCLFCGLHSFFVLPDIRDRMASYMHLS